MPIQIIDNGANLRRYVALSCGDYWVTSWKVETHNVRDQMPYGFIREIELSVNPDYAHVMGLRPLEVERLCSVLNVGAQLKEGITSAGPRAILSRTQGDLTRVDNEQARTLDFTYDFTELRDPIKPFELGYSMEHGRYHPAGDPEQEQWVIRRNVEDNTVQGQTKAEYLFMLGPSGRGDNGRVRASWSEYTDHAMKFSAYEWASEFAQMAKETHEVNIDAIERIA